MAIRFLDLFAGAGGLSEGFIQAGYKPVAHVEMDTAACNTLRTRAAFHYLHKTEEGRQNYKDYLLGKISRRELYSRVPQKVLDTVIEEAIGTDTISSIFEKIDNLCTGKKIDLVIGGPPCQAYSLVGRGRTKGKILSDPRNSLYKFYVQFLEKYKPRYFVFENVTGLLTARDKDGRLYYDLIKQSFEKAGYSIHREIVSMEGYGLPQRRRRVIIIGRCKDGVFSLEPQIEIKGVASCHSVESILSDLSPLQSDEGSIRGNGQRRNHKAAQWLYDNGIADDIYPVTYQQSRPLNQHDKEVYRRVVQLWNESRQRFNYATDLPESMRTHRNCKSFLDRFKVVDGKSNASQTLVAHITKDGHYFIHYDIKQNRSITPREAARLQTFPDNYFFENSSEKDGRGAAYRQIGNAVPVLMARLIAQALKKEFSV